MRDEMFQAISGIIAKHHNPDYDCGELMDLEYEHNATIYTLDARDVRLATDEIIDLIADFFIKGKELSKERGPQYSYKTIYNPKLTLWFVYDRNHDGIQNAAHYLTTSAEKAESWFKQDFPDCEDYILVESLDDLLDDRRY
jgi:hypothetical protein